MSRHVTVEVRDNIQVALSLSVFRRDAPAKVVGCLEASSLEVKKKKKKFTEKLEKWRRRRVQAERRQPY